MFNLETGEITLKRNREYKNEFCMKKQQTALFYLTDIFDFVFYYFLSDNKIFTLNINTENNIFLLSDV